MKTLPLSEALKLATPGKLFAAENGALFCKEERTGLVGQLRIAADPHQPFGTTEEQANAALLAHSMNTRDGLIEALEKALDRQYNPQNPAKNSDLRAVLAKARAVEMP